jgi:hypothetical protein
MHSRGKPPKACGTSERADLSHSCLTSGEYSDLTIQCGDDVYKVHKVVVCTRAGFFARAIKFGGKVTKFFFIYVIKLDNK